MPDVLATVNNDLLRGFTKQEWTALKEFLQRVLVNAQELQDNAEDVS